MTKTVKELADELGLSTATVSRALRGDAHVLPGTRERVTGAAGDGLSRERRSSAEVRGGKTFLIVAAKLTNPIVLGFIDGLRTELEKENFRTLISLTDYSSDAECDAIAYAERNGMSGIFLLNAIETPALISRLKKTKKPVVLLNRYLGGIDCDVVMIDNYRCGYLAAEYLIGRGHRSIGHLAGPDTSVTCRDRTRGFLDAMKSHGLDGTKFLYYGDRTWEAGAKYAALYKSIDEALRPTALFSTTGLMAAGAVTGLRGEGIRIPEQLSVIISDDYSKSYMPYPIDFTCFGRDPLNMGAAAAQLMLSRLSTPDIAPRKTVLPPVLSEYNSVLKK